MKLANWFAVLGCLGVAGSVAMASQGCTATITAGSGDDTFGDDSGVIVPQQDSGSTPPNACLECLYGKCSGLYSVCVNDPGCLAIYQCATVPSCAGDATGACVTACIAAQPAASQNIYDNLGACDYLGECDQFFGTCAATCAPPADYCSPTVDDDAGTDSAAPVVDSAAPTDDAGTDSAVPVVDAGSPPSCQSCQAATCASQLAACAAGTACATYNTCVLGCETAECTAICGSNSPTGLQAAQALGTCTTTGCPICSQ